MTFASIVNRECEKFRLSEITPDMFKCLIFIQGLTAPKDAEIKSRLRTKLEQDQKILQSLMDECQCILNSRADTAKIEEQDISHIHALQNKPKGRKNKPFIKSIPALVVVNYIYFGIVLLRTKSVKIVWTKDLNFPITEKSPKIRWKIIIWSIVLLNKKQSRQ